MAKIKKSKVKISNRNTNKNKIHIVINPTPAKRRRRKHAKKEVGHPTIQYHSFNPPLLPPPTSYLSSFYPPQKETATIPMNNEVKDSFADIKTYHREDNPNLSYGDIYQPENEVNQINPMTHKPDDNKVGFDFPELDNAYPDIPPDDVSEVGEEPVTESLQPTVTQFRNMSAQNKKDFLVQHGVEEAYKKANHDRIVHQLTEMGALRRVNQSRPKAQVAQAENVLRLEPNTPATAQATTPITRFFTPRTGERLKKD